MNLANTKASLVNRFMIAVDGDLFRVSFGECVNGAEPDRPLFSAVMTTYNARELRDLLSRMLDIKQS